MGMTEKVYVTDCEGPVSKNDNAYEIADAFLKDGGKLFSLLSKFDDYLGDIEKIEGYRYGSTLKFILPFLKAAGVTDKDAKEFLKNNMVLIPGVRDTLREIKNLMKIYMVSTSYRHYIEAISEYIGMEKENIFCTEVDFDSYEMGEEERKAIAFYHERFLELPFIEWDESGVVRQESLRSIEELKNFFFSTLPLLPVFQWMDKVIPTGGEGKADAIIEITKKNKVSISNVMYVGDSITDLDALTLVNSRGGLSVSFNGNSYAVRGAEFVVVSRDAGILKDIAFDFFHYGKEGIRVGKFAPQTYVYRKEDSNLEEVIRLSEKIRKEVRGEMIGGLG